MFLPSCSARGCWATCLLWICVCRSWWWRRCRNSRAVSRTVAWETSERLGARSEACRAGRGLCPTTIWTERLLRPLHAHVLPCPSFSLMQINHLLRASSLLGGLPCPASQFSEPRRGLTAALSLGSPRPRDLPGPAARPEPGSTLRPPGATRLGQSPFSRPGHFNSTPLLPALSYSSPCTPGLSNRNRKRLEQGRPHAQGQIREPDVQKAREYWRPRGTRGWAGSLQRQWIPAVPARGILRELHFPRLLPSWWGTVGRRLQPEDHHALSLWPQG